MLLTALSLVLLLASLAQLTLALRSCRAVPSLDALPPAQTPPSGWPVLSVIVPAKDEGAHIEAALRSKLGCAYPALQVVVVDDRSTDDTPTILARMRGEQERARREDPSLPELVVTRVDALPDGWLGKLHAMHRGLSVATGEWALFADADVHLAPSTLDRIIAHAERAQIDFVAVFPKMEPVNLVIDASLAGLLRALMLAARMWKANTDGSGIGAGVGAFNLARRRWLEDTRAIEQLRMEIADDVALGALLKQSGARTRLFVGRESVSLVFQDSLSALFRSADKGGGMFGWVLWRPVVMALAPTLIELVLPVAAIIHGGVAATAGALSLAAITATHVIVSAHCAVPVRGAWLWPLGHVFNAATMLRAGWLAWRRQGVVWRSTFYPREVVDAGRRMDLTTMKVAVREG